MKVKDKLQRLLLSLCFALLVAGAGREVCLAEGETTGAPGDTTPTETPDETPAATPAPVKPVEIDYDELWLKVDKAGNTAVYYSDKGKKVWSEALPSEGDYYLIDISWLKATTATEINLKGDKNEEIVPVTLPLRESKYKIKFDKVKGILTITNLPSSVEKLEWRKATSYQWTDVTVDDAKNPESAFAKAMSELRVAGASIYVRTKGTKGGTGTGADAALEVGTRPGKEIKVSIPKFSNAPKIKIDGSKMTLNTTTSMEYSTDNGKTWTQAEKKLPIAKVAQGALAGPETSGQKQIVWIRKKATSRTPQSKICVLEIPAQRQAPSGADVPSKMEDGKFCLDFQKASKTDPYEYTVVKAGDSLDVTKASWKAVIAPKKILLSNRTAPTGSIIYVRKKTVKQTTTANFELASYYLTIPVPAYPTN